MERKPETESGEGTNDLLRNEALAALKEGVQNNPEARNAYMRWVTSGEERRDRGEVTQEALTKDSINLLLEAGLYAEAVEAAEEITKQFGPVLEEGENPEEGVSTEGNDLYWFCVGILNTYG